MAEFNVRSDAVDVEQIMAQIRARIREKRGADYTEAELQQLASVKLEKFLDPRGLRSDLVEQFRRNRAVTPAPPKLPKFQFEDTTLYETHRGLLRMMRRLLHPILKLFINPNPLIHAMHIQAHAMEVQGDINAEFHLRFRQRDEMDPLYYEVVHNLVVELTRLGIEVHNLKMRVESLSSRLEFDERRARSLEGVVQYRKPAAAPSHAPAAGPSGGPSAARAAAPSGTAPSAPPADTQSAPAGAPAAGSDGERRRRRRRRRRRPGQTSGDRAGTGSGGGRPDAAEFAGADSGDADEGSDDGPEDTPETPDDSPGSDR